jgi:chemotaxis protein MotB
MARRAKHEEHENHDRWLVSYADFITLLFAFFVVMYAVSQVNEGKYRVLSDSLGSAFKSTPRPVTPLPVTKQQNFPSGSSDVNRQSLPLRKGDGHRQQEAKLKSIAKDVMEALGPLVQNGQVRVTQSSRGVAVEINASVLFATAQAELRRDSVKALQAVAQVLATVENPIQVEGHSDNSPIRTPIYPSNWELSGARASSVVRLFVDSGVAPQRLVAMGYGENKPVASNDNIEGRSRNRRVTIMILSEIPENVREIPVKGVSMGAAL